MNKNFFLYSKKYYQNFFWSYLNLNFFLGYFFSFPKIFLSLFKPWKNLIVKYEKPGFSISEWANILMFNLISRIIGFFLRISLIIFYIFLQTLFVISFFPLLIISTIFLPILFFINLFLKSEEEKYNDQKSIFLKTHILDKNNIKAASDWFNIIFQKNKINFFSKENLFKIPPLARDWDMGFTPTLNKFGYEINDNYFKFRNLVDREEETKKIEQTLIKNEGANIVLVGEEGVGRTTIIAGIAKRIFEGKINSLLAYKRVFKIDIEKILSETTDINQKENILKKLFEEAREAGNLIILIDNIEKYLTSEFGKLDLTNLIEEFAKHTSLHIVGITTPFFYQKVIYPNSKISQLFEKIDVYEIDKNKAEKILLDNALDFEKQYNVIVTFEAIIEALNKSDRYITNIPFPEKAIDLIHNACSFLAQNNNKELSILTPEIIDKVLSEKTHIPVKMSDDFKQKLVNLEKSLFERVLFQDDAIKKVANVLRKSFVEADTRKKPIASFLFLGKTGVGKTETAKALAKTFFDSDNQMIRVDMSYYQNDEDIDKLLGNQEKNNPGILTTEIRQKPYAVLLIDEIEKASRNILNIFLTALDEGYFVDGWGKKIDAKNLIIVATSNAASETLINTQMSDNSLINLLVEKKYFSPEFLNRFDGIIIYKSLDKAAIKLIAKNIIQKIIIQNKINNKIIINVSDEYLNKIIENGYDEKFGARNIQRLISQEIESKIANMILENKIIPNQIINFP